MRIRAAMLVTFASLALSGCASINYHAPAEKGLMYFEPIPTLVATDTIDCKQVLSVLMVPGRVQHLEFNGGLGSSTQTVDLTNGMVTKVSQVADNKMFDLLKMAAGAAGVALLAETKPSTECVPQTRTYAIKYTGAAPGVLDLTVAKPEIREPKPGK